MIEELKLFTNLGMTGLVVWLVYWTVKVMFPRMVRDFRVDLREERSAIRELADQVSRNSKILLLLFAKQTKGDLDGLEEIFEVKNVADPEGRCSLCPFVKAAKAAERSEATIGG